MPAEAAQPLRERRRGPTIIVDDEDPRGLG
jgi:hypothetical protein